MYCFEVVVSVHPKQSEVHQVCAEQSPCYKLKANLCKVASDYHSL